MLTQLPIFMRNNHIPTNFDNNREWHCFTFLQISLMSGLIEDSWILISASAVNLLWQIVFTKVHEEILPHRINT